MKKLILPVNKRCTYRNIIFFDFIYFLDVLFFRKVRCVKKQDVLNADAHCEKSSAFISATSTKKSKGQKPYTLFFADFRMSLCVHLNQCEGRSRETQSSSSLPELYMAFFLVWIRYLYIEGMKSLGQSRIFVPFNQRIEWDLFDIQIEEVSGLVNLLEKTFSF